MKTAIHNSGENGMRKANNGMSVLTFGAASKETPLWKYGALKSITSARILQEFQKLAKIISNFKKTLRRNTQRCKGHVCSA